MKRTIKPPDELELRRLAAKAELVKALAHPLRLAIIEFLSGGERCVCEIAELAGAERSNISRHLALMVRAGVLANRKQGLQVYYRLRCACVAHFLDCVANLLDERLSEDAALARPADARSSPQRPSLDGLKPVATRSVRRRRVKRVGTGFSPYSARGHSTRKKKKP